MICLDSLLNYNISAVELFKEVIFSNRPISPPLVRLQNDLLLSLILSVFVVSRSAKSVTGGMEFT
jgi:hypothetical protein